MWSWDSNLCLKPGFLITKLVLGHEVCLADCESDRIGSVRMYHTNIWVSFCRTLVYMYLDKIQNTVLIVDHSHSHYCSPDSSVPSQSLCLDSFPSILPWQIYTSSASLMFSEIPALSALQEEPPTHSIFCSTSFIFLTALLTIWNYLLLIKGFIHCHFPLFPAQVHMKT